MRHNDILLALSLTASALALWAVLALSGFFGKNRTMEVVVSVNGVETERHALDEDALFSVLAEGGENVVEIKDGTCRVTGADCPDRLCVKQGVISRTGEAIICLPHRLTVEIVSADGPGTDGFDAVSE